MSLFYSLFVFRLCYKIIGFSKLSGLRAAGLPIFGPRVWAGPGPETCGPGRAWAKHSRSGSGLGLNSSLRAWAGFEKIIAGLGRAWTLTANCGPGLGSNSRPVQGTNIYHIYLHTQNFVTIQCNTQTRTQTRTHRCSASHATNYVKFFNKHIRSSIFSILCWLEKFDIYFL